MRIRLAKRLAAVGLAAGSLIPAGGSPAQAIVWSGGQDMTDARQVAGWAFRHSNRYFGREMVEMSRSWRQPELVIDGRTDCFGDDNALYCRRDETIAVKLRWMRTQLVARGDYAEAVVIAHEFAHHVQHLRNMWAITIRQELNADCLAGMFTRYARNAGMLTSADFYEGRNELNYAGDRGSSSTHGTDDQRKRWYTYGYNHHTSTSTLRACDVVYRGPVSDL